MPSLPAPLGPYRLERKLGGGGFADVWLAVDTRRGHQVALKVLHPHHANSVEVRRRFEREGEQMLKLRHQYIVGAYDVGQIAGYHTIAMPYLAGGSLADVLRMRGRLDLPTAAAIVGQVAAALDFVHPQVIHRDLKPSNVLLDGQGNCLVADFGVAHVAGEATLTLTGYQPGTPHYMAPEQVRPALGKIGPATDVWALGVILYEMVCGRRPFEAEDSQAVLFQVVNDTPRWPSELKLGLPAGLDAVMQRALARNPRQRYQRAGELAQAVQQMARTVAASASAPVIGAGPTRLRTPTPPRQSPAPAGRGEKRGAFPLLLGATGGVAALAILLLVLLLSGQSPSVEPTQIPPTRKATVVADVSNTATMMAATILTPTSTLEATARTMVTAATVITPTSTVGAAATPSPIPTATRPAPKSTTPQSATRTPVKATAPTLPAPALLTPEPGYTAAQGSIAFKWQAVPGAQSYRVETLSTREGFKEWKVWETPTATEWTLHFDGDQAYFHEAGTDYYWRVVAVDGRGQVGAYSEERRFVFNRPQLTPALTPPPDEPTPEPTP